MLHIKRKLNETELLTKDCLTVEICKAQVKANDIYQKY